MQRGMYGYPKGGNQEILRQIRGPGLGWEMAARAGDTGLTIPVVTHQPITPNSAFAMDVTPKGPIPVEFAGNGFAWIDVCDADVRDSNTSNGVPIPIRCDRVAMTSTGAQIGQVTFNGASALPIEFLVDFNTVRARMSIAGLQVGSATRTAISRVEATDDTIVNFMNVFGGEGVTGTSTNHPYSVWTNNVKRAIFDTSGNLTGLLSLQRTGGVAVQGSNTNDAASAGYAGEAITASREVGSATALTTATPLNVTSISLTAGDWDVTAQAYMLLAATTSLTNFLYGITSTSATLDVSAGKWVNYSTPATVLGNVNSTFGAVTYRISLASTTTIFLMAQGTFTVSTASAWGNIMARRVR